MDQQGASREDQETYSTPVRPTPAFSSGPGGAPLARHRAEPNVPCEPGKGRDARIRLLQRVVSQTLLLREPKPQATSTILFFSLDAAWIQQK